MPRAERRGGSKLSRTLYESPATASLHSQPQKKNVPCFSDLRAPDFSENGKDIFLLGFCSQVFGQCGGASIGLGFAKTIFWGLDFRKTETNLFLDFVRAEEDPL